MPDNTHWVAADTAAVCGVIKPQNTGRYVNNANWPTEEQLAFVASEQLSLAHKTHIDSQRTAMYQNVYGEGTKFMCLYFTR